MMVRHEDCVVTDRSDIVENRYNVHAAVVDIDGTILYAVGDPSRVTLARSAAKPVQALAVLETGVFERCSFDDADLALMCASHNSEERHVARARTMLGKAGAEEQDLRCGGHPALSEAVNRQWIKQDFLPSAVYNNCSGKHAGMLAGANTIGAGFRDYHMPTHPMQVRVKETFEDLSCVGANGVRWGIDGCNLPAPASALHVLARIYASFAAAVDATETDQAVSSRTSAMTRIFRAMTRHPELVGGETRFCTELMSAFSGELMGKVGADGCYGVSARSSKQTRRLGTEGAIGIAVKIEDGNINILYSVVMEILEQLGIGSLEAREKLSHFHKQDIVNTMGVVTGRVSHLFKIRRLEHTQ